MSRREEVEASKWSVDCGDLAIGRFRLQCTSPHDIAKWHNDKALTLASEVDELRKEKQRIADEWFDVSAQRDALEAERDEWKRRCEKMVAHIEPVGDQITCQCRECKVIRDKHETLLAIAEGRDNG